MVGDSPLSVPEREAAKRGAAELFIAGFPDWADAIDHVLVALTDLEEQLVEAESDWKVTSRMAATTRKRAEQAEERERKALQHLDDALMAVAVFAPHGMDSTRVDDYYTADQIRAAIKRAQDALATSPSEPAVSPFTAEDFQVKDIDRIRDASETRPSE